MSELVRFLLHVAHEVDQDISELRKPPEEGEFVRSDGIISFSIVRKTRGYIERVVNQINGAYQHGWYDACAVMIRRLVETLIIESFECYGISDRIKNSQGDFFYHLRDLIQITLNETAWNLSRNAKHALPRLKDIGDQSAHNRRYSAHRNDIEKLTPDLRAVVQELVALAKLK